VQFKDDITEIWKNVMQSSKMLERTQKYVQRYKKGRNKQPKEIANYEKVFEMEDRNKQLKEIASKLWKGFWNRRKVQEVTC